MSWLHLQIEHDYYKACMERESDSVGYYDEKYVASSMSYQIYI